MLRVGSRNMAGRELEIDWKEGVLESSARKMTVSLIRVTACGFGLLVELAIPYGTLLMPKCEEYVSGMVPSVMLLFFLFAALLTKVVQVCLITNFVAVWLLHLLASKRPILIRPCQSSWCKLPRRVAPPPHRRSALRGSVVCASETGCRSENHLGFVNTRVYKVLSDASTRVNAIAKLRAYIMYELCAHADHISRSLSREVVAARSYR